MLRIGLTGNIGSGKTTVCKIFEVLGIPVFHADEEAKKLYFHESVIKETKEAVGEDIISDGKIVFKRLAEVIFADKIKLKAVNDIIHPMIYDMAETWYKAQSDVPYIIHESAIIFENNLQGRYDKVISVSAGKDLRVERVLKRDGADLKDVVARINNQMNDKRKAELSDFVIYNNVEDLLIPQVLKIHKSLSK